ncbi:MAG TPA: FG-GAP repeat protein [Ferruginibacter sp.]|nr:FG-GAP repeat protein [Ferruginibacter sp.]
MHRKMIANIIFYLKQRIKSRHTIYIILPQFLFLFDSYSSFAQCTGTVQNPLLPVMASAYNDTLLVQTNSQPGQFFRVENLSLNKTYVFLSSAAGDYITIRNAYTNAALAQGPAPLTYAVGAGPDVVTVHLNLQSPSCGTAAVNRTTRLACTNCPAIPGKVEVGNTAQNASLDVKGEIKLSNSTRPPEAGMIRWNPGEKDFEGFNGTAWVSLTKANGNTGQWGQIAPATLQENNRLIASDGAAGDVFGVAVSISGDYAIIGASADDVASNTDQGSAYIFVRNGNNWIQQAKLIASDGASNDNFGTAVSISGDYAIVGALTDDIGANTDQGSAYIFVRSGTTWTQQAKITASDGAASDLFGNAVSISGNYVIIGARSDDVGVADKGSAYIYVRSGTNWTLQAKLTDLDGVSGDRFGSSVCISGDDVIVAADQYDEVGRANQGAAFIYARNGILWILQGKLVPADGAANDKFGASVSVHGNYAIVGAEQDQVGSNFYQGSAYIFMRNGSTWTQQAKLTATDGKAYDQFGIAVSISGDYAIAGARLAEINLNEYQGSAYIFMRSGTNWLQQAKLTASDGVANDQFGAAVCLSGNYAIVGAIFDQIGTFTYQGSAYIFRKN